MLEFLAVVLAQTYIAEQVSFGGNLNYCAETGLYASIDVFHGIATGGPVFPNASGLSLELVGRRRDDVGNVLVRSEVWVDGGIVLGVYAANCGYGAAPLFACGPDGCSYGWALHPDCSGNSDIFAGGLVDASGVAGHFSLRSGPRNQLTSGGQLALIQDAVLTNNEQPNPENYPSGVVGTRDGGAHFFYYSGDHGSHTFADTSRMYAGSIVQFDNLDRPGTRHVAGVDHNGAYYQSHGLHREDFPSPAPLTVTTSVGPFYYFRESRLLYAFDTHHWFFSNGEQWVEFVEKPVNEARLALIEARLTALEACQ